MPNMKMTEAQNWESRIWITGNGGQSFRIRKTMDWKMADRRLTKHPSFSSPSFSSRRCFSRRCPSYSGRAWISVAPNTMQSLLTHCTGASGAQYAYTVCGLVSDSTRRSLRSADVSTCVVPPTLSSYGDWTFAAAGPRLWNSLPVQLRNRDINY